MGMFLNFVQYMTGADPGIFVRGGPTHPITGFKDDSAYVTTTTAGP